MSTRTGSVTGADPDGVITSSAVLAASSLPLYGHGYGVVPATYMRVLIADVTSGLRQLTYDALDEVVHLLDGGVIGHGSRRDGHTAGLVLDRANEG